MDSKLKECSVPFIDLPREFGMTLFSLFKSHIAL